MKSKQARIKYSEDIQLMRQYSDQHGKKTLTIDNEMDSTIGSWTNSEEHKKRLQVIWEEECRQNAQLSQQLWLRRETFLRSKKKEGEEKENANFITETEETIIKRRSNMKRNRFKIRRGNQEKLTTNPVKKRELRDCEPIDKQQESEKIKRSYFKT